MRWPIKLLLFFVLVSLLVLALMKFLPSGMDIGGVGDADESRAAALLARAEAATNRNTRGRDFLKRVYSREREAAAPATANETDTPGLTKIEDILESTDADTEKARRLLALAPSLPDEEKMEAADHAANLVDDENYPVLRDALVNAQTPEPVIDGLLADLLNRGNSIKLNTLVDIARQPEHPRAVEARDLLELHLGEDHGTNWSEWLDLTKNYIGRNGE